MGGTDANVVSVSVGDLPTCRNGQRLAAVADAVDPCASIDFVKMQCHVQVRAVLLRGRVGGWEGEGGEGLV